MIKINGFTLIEMLFTLMLIAILSIFSLTSASFIMYKNDQQTIVDEIRTAIQYAKNQAVILGHPVSLSPGDKELNWSKGIILSRMQSKTGKSPVLYQWSWHHPHWNITWSGMNSPHKISLSNNPVSAISNGHFVLFNTRTKERVELILNRLGRIRIKSME